MTRAPPFGNASVEQAFRAVPPGPRKRLLALRAIIFDTAARTPGVGVLDETLKWGEPAYVTTQSGSGSTVRLGWKKADPGSCAMYFNCRTTLVETFRSLFPNEFRFEGQRAMVFGADDPMPADSIALCVAAALTYHAKKRGSIARRPSGTTEMALPTSPPLQFTLHDDVPADAADVVDAGLGASNDAAAPLHEVQPLACFARLPGREVVGGAVGRTWGTCCELQQLWVEPALRRQGVGKRLVEQFEARARVRGCRTFYLETFSFQAPGLYRSLGYEVRLELRGFGPGIVKYTMVHEWP